MNTFHLLNTFVCLLLFNHTPESTITGYNDRTVITPLSETIYSSSNPTSSNPTIILDRITPPCFNFTNHVEGKVHIAGTLPFVHQTSHSSGVIMSESSSGVTPSISITQESPENSKKSTQNQLQEIMNLSEKIDKAHKGFMVLLGFVMMGSGFCFYWSYKYWDHNMDTILDFREEFRDFQAERHRKAAPHHRANRFPFPISTSPAPF